MPDTIPCGNTMEVGWQLPIKFLTRDLHGKCIKWAVARNHYPKSQPTQARFLNQCKHLGLPLSTENTLYNGLPTRSFVPKSMHEHIVANKWVEEDEADDSTSDDDEDIETFCRKFVGELIGKAVHKSEIKGMFFFNPTS